MNNILKALVPLAYLFLFANQVLASDLSIGRMRVAIWPEYDDPGILAIYDGRFKDENLFPTETAFLIPADAAISDACSLSPKGQHFCQLYKQKNAGNNDEVSMKLPYPNFYLSFHINPFREKKDNRTFTYAIKVNHPTDKLEVEIQRPLRAEGFSIMPQPEEKTEKKGFEHYSYLFENVPKGKVLEFNVEYVKKDSQPSVNIKYSPMNQPAPAGIPAAVRPLTVIYIAGGVGVLAMIGLLWFIFKRKR